MVKKSDLKSVWAEEWFCAVFSVVDNDEGQAVGSRFHGFLGSTLQLVLNCVRFHVLPDVYKE